MRILVVSDTHGNDSMLFKAYQQAGTPDVIIHAGDGEQDALLLDAATDEQLWYVAGNCDHGSSAPRERLITLAGRRLLITHGDLYNVKNGLELLVAQGKASKADIILFGHTHQAFAEQRGGMHLLNPGTLWGRAPFLSYGILEINGQQINATIHKIE